MPILSREAHAKRSATYEAKRPDRFWKKVQRKKDDECWIFTGNPGHRYGKVNCGPFQLGAHQFSYELHYGPIPEGQVVMHTCDNVRCVNPAHLKLGTHQDNQADKVNKGRQARGSRQGHSRLSEEDVLIIKRRIAGGEAIKTIASDYRIALQTIYLIRAGKAWKHVGNDV